MSANFDTHKKTITIALTQPDWEKLNADARKKHNSLTGIIGAAVQEFVDRLPAAPASVAVLPPVVRGETVGGIPPSAVVPSTGAVAAFSGVLEAGAGTEARSGGSEAPPWATSGAE